MRIILGGYTDPEHQYGLKALELDESSGAISLVAEHKLSNALYQALSPDGKYLYSCTGEGLSSFCAEDLKPVDSLSLGNCVCHVSVIQEGQRVVFADYLGGFAGSVEVKDGKFGKVVKHQHSGSGPNLPRQDNAHCHQAVALPDGSGYCAVDLGLDELVEYPLGRVFNTPPKGAGPRHLLFHPNGRLAFLVYELGNLVASLSWSPAEGFKMLDAHPTLADSPNSTIPHSSNLAAAIRFTPDMKRIVVSNRGENSLVVFDFDETTGKMSFTSRTMLPGNWPRDFIFATDTRALVACERSGEVVSLSFDPEKGTFTPQHALKGLFRPVALLSKP